MNETELKTQPAPASAEPAVSVPEKSEETVSESTAQQLLSSAKIQEKCAKKSLLHQRIRTVLAVIVAVAALSMIGSISATMHDVQLLTNNASYAVTNLTNTINELDLKKTLAAIDDMVQDGTVLIDQGNTMIRNSSQDIETSLPLKDAQCTPVSIATAPEATKISAEDHPQRTAYFDTIYQKDMPFVTEFTYEIDAPYVKPDPQEVISDRPNFDIQESLPHIRFTPFIRALCAELKGSENNPLLIARRFYDYCTTQAVYRFVPPYFTKVNIPEYFAAGQRGDCGMHAITFITLCRCAGIPAQWQAGLYARPTDVGNHDWARFYIAPYGWLYADCSFGGSAYRAGALDRWDFYFGNLDPFRMVANRAFQQDFDPPMHDLRADPYDSQSGEVEYDDQSLTYHDFTMNREILSWEELS